MASRFTRPTPPRIPLNIGAILSGVLGGIQQDKSLKLASDAQAASLANATAERQATGYALDAFNRAAQAGTSGVEPSTFEDPLGIGADQTFGSRLSRSINYPFNDEMRGRIIEKVLGPGSVGTNTSDLGALIPSNENKILQERLLRDVLQSSDFPSIFSDAYKGKTVAGGLAPLGPNVTFNPYSGQFFTGQTTSAGGITKNPDGSFSYAGETLNPPSTGRLRVRPEDLLGDDSSPLNKSPLPPIDLQSVLMPTDIAPPRGVRPTTNPETRFQQELYKDASQPNQLEQSIKEQVRRLIEFILRGIPTDAPL